MMTSPTPAQIKQARVKAGLGRPQEMKSGKRVNVYLDAASLARAAKLGNGNVSAGIRKALREFVFVE